MSWENQQTAGSSSLNELLAQPLSQPQQNPQTDAERIDFLTQKVNYLEEQVQNGPPRKAPRTRKATLVSLDAKIVSIEAKIDLILNILNQHS